MNDQGDVQKISIDDVFLQQQVERGMVVDITKMTRSLPRSEFSAGANLPPGDAGVNSEGFLVHWHTVDKWTDSMLLSIVPQNILESDPAIQSHMGVSMGITLETTNAEGNKIFTAEKYDGAYHIESWELLTDDKGIILAMGHYSRDRKVQPEKSSWDQYDFRTDTHRYQVTQSLNGVESELIDGKTELISQLGQDEAEDFLQQALEVINA